MKNISFKRITAILLVCLLLAPVSLLENVTLVKAESVFTFDGTNASKYNYQNIIEFNLSSIDITNNQVAELVQEMQNVGDLKLIFKKSVTIIGNNVFENCYNLQTVDFSQADNLKIIEDNAFKGCNTLCKSVYKSGNSYITTSEKDGIMWLPAGLSFFGESCFADTQIFQYNISADNNSFTTEDGVLYNKKTDILIAFPPANTGNNGAYIIPEHVSAIYQYAFERSCINKISIPKTVTTIGQKAFYNSLLSAVTFDDDANVSIGSGAFYQDPEDQTYAHAGLKEWKGIQQVFLSQSTYESSLNNIQNTDATACFTPFVKKEESAYGYALGCDVYVVPKVTVSGVPQTWAGSAKLNFFWTNSDYYNITALYLDGNREVTFEPGTTASEAIEVTENGIYTLTIKYANKNKNIATSFFNVNIDKVDSISPADVTYTMVDDVCYLHSFDTESGLDQIKYELNNGDTINYSEGFALQPGINTLTTWATDNVGNSSNRKVYEIRIPEVIRSISVDKTSKQLTLGKSFTLNVIFNPSNVTNKDVVYTSSDPSVATVSSTGVVKGIRVGYAVITVTANGGYNDKCAVIVTKDPTVKKEISLYKSNSYKLSIKNLRNDYDVTFSTDDKKICKVDDKGKITAIGVGEATVTTKVDTGVRVYKLKTVVTVLKPKVVITTEPKSIKVGQKYTFKAYRKGLSKEIKWSSSKKSVATINKTTGRAIGQKKGTTTIRATCGKYKYNYKLKVK